MADYLCGKSPPVRFLFFSSVVICFCPASSFAIIFCELSLSFICRNCYWLCCFRLILQTLFLRSKLCVSILDLSDARTFPGVSIGTWPPAKLSTIICSCVWVRKFEYEVRKSSFESTRIRSTIIFSAVGSTIIGKYDIVCAKYDWEVRE